MTKHLERPSVSLNSHLLPMFSTLRSSASGLRLIIDRISGTPLVLLSPTQSGYSPKFTMQSGDCDALVTIMPYAQLEIL